MSSVRNVAPPKVGSNIMLTDRSSSRGAWEGRGELALGIAGTLAAGSGLACISERARGVAGPAAVILGFVAAVGGVVALSTANFDKDTMAQVTGTGYASASDAQRGAAANGADSGVLSIPGVSGFTAVRLPDGSNLHWHKEAVYDSEPQPVDPQDGEPTGPQPPPKKVGMRAVPVSVPELSHGMRWDSMVTADGEALTPKGVDLGPARGRVDVSGMDVTKAAAKLAGAVIGSDSGHQPIRLGAQIGKPGGYDSLKAAGTDTVGKDANAAPHALVQVGDRFVAFSLAGGKVGSANSAGSQLPAGDVWIQNGAMATQAAGSQQPYSGTRRVVPFSVDEPVGKTIDLGGGNGTLKVESYVATYKDMAGADAYLHDKGRAADLASKLGNTAGYAVVHQSSAQGDYQLYKISNVDGGTPWRTDDGKVMASLTEQDYQNDDVVTQFTTTHYSTPQAVLSEGGSDKVLANGTKTKTGSEDRTDDNGDTALHMGQAANQLQHVAVNHDFEASAGDWVAIVGHSGRALGRPESFEVIVGETGQSWVYKNFFGKPGEAAEAAQQQLNQFSGQPQDTQDAFFPWSRDGSGN
jgi:hypothetical protein